jgi:hypothetical protein
LISEKLAGLYTKAEDKYFDLLDFLDAKGLPVYKYSDFFENKGIPSFVVTIAVLVLLLLILTLALTFKPADVSELTLSLRDAEGNPLQNVKITVTDGKDAVLFDGIRSDGDKIQLNRGLFSGETINISASKNGYQDRSIQFTVGKDTKAATISFDKAYEGIDAKIRIIDNETKTFITDAIAIATIKDLSFTFEEDSNGTYKKSGVPGGVTMLLKISAEGYNNYEQQVVFNSGEIRTISLSPSSEGYVGKANVAILVRNTEELAIDDAKVTVYDLQNDIAVLTNYTYEGLVIGEIQAGVPLRIVVEKQGYLTYDSEKEGQSITIREKEKQVIVTIKQGGQKLHVSVFESTGFGLEGAIVQLVSEDGFVFGQATTAVSGVDFNGLNPEDTIYVTAYREGYLPAREKVLVSTTEEVRLVMEKVNASNSSILEIFAIDKSGNSVNGVKLQIFEIVDGNRLPYGMAGIETSFAGYAEMKVSPNKTFEIHGETEFMVGAATTEVRTGDAEKKVYLNMQKKDNVLEMKFIDVYGKEILGTALISSLGGEAFYDGNIVNSRVFFDAQQKEVVEVQVTLPDGNVFTENVTVKGKDYVEVMVYSKDPSILSPAIEFIGIENESGESVEGMTPGAFFWAKYSVTFPRAATRGGVHFRAGADNVPFAESEKFGVFDLSLQGAEIAQSYSYTPTPVPGNELVDRSNSVTTGEKSKWIEGSIANPQGTYAVKVKVRAEDFTEGKAQLRYRAWSFVGDDYYRSPTDAELGTKLSTDTKAGLYAETSLTELNLYETLPECMENLCITTNFVDDEEKFINENGFEALKGKIYALEISLTAKEADYIQLSAITDGNIIGFTSTQTGNFNFVRETGYDSAGSAKASATVSLSKEGKEKVRFYFLSQNVGSALIAIKATGKTTVEKDVLFNVVQEKRMLIELSDSQVMAGKNFTVKVTDEGLKSLENVLVKIVDREGKVSKSIIGDATDGKGKNGYYRIQNNLSVGLYTVEVSLPNYATETLPVLITTQTILTFPETIEVKMPLGQKSMMVSELLANNSDFVVQNITVETENETTTENSSVATRSTTNAGKFKVTAIAPTVLGSGKNQAVSITVSYTGANDDSADETAILTISGLLEGKFHTSVSSTIHMVYNRQLAASCLKIDPTSVTINLLGSEGSTGSETVEVTNSCDQAISLTQRVKEKTKKSFIIVTAEPIVLAQGEAKNITINANNLIERGNTREQLYSYEVIFDSNYLKKTLPVNVKVVNPQFSLSYPAQVTLWLAQSSPSEKAIAAQPIFVTNTSSFPVENISFAVATNALSGANIKLSIEPPGAVSLQRGQAIIPAKLVVATAQSKVSDPVEGYIDITGRMGELNNRAGQNDRYNYYENYYSGAASLANYSPSQKSYYQNTSSILGRIKVLVFYSGYNCLSARVTDDAGTDYQLPIDGGQLAKKITVTNRCAEPVRLVGATPAGQTQNPVNPILGVPIMASSILMGVPQVSIPPNGGMVEVPLTIMTAMPNVNRKNYSIVVNGVSEISGTPITSQAFGINIYSGNDLTAEHVKARLAKVKVCGVNGAAQTTEDATFPMVSTSSNCAESYCDAQQAAKYISEKIRQVIRNAQSKGYANKNKDQLDCQATGACTFDELGINPEYIDLYLQNDALTSAILQKELNNVGLENSSSTPFRETIGSVGFSVDSYVFDAAFSTQVLRMIAASGLDRRILLDRELSGCGYYRLSISGAFRAGPEGIEPMTPAVSIRTVPQGNGSKLFTRECRDSITNIANFNPIDLGLEPNTSYGTWVSSIETEPVLNELAKKISSLRYKTDKRIMPGNGNKLIITQGAFSGTLAQMCLAGGEKKTITLTIDNSFVRADKASKEAYSQAIVKMVTDGLAGSFGENCLVKSGDVYTCVKLTDVGNLGTRRIEMSEPTLEISETGGCVDATVYSTFNEGLNFDVEPFTLSKNFDSIRRIEVLANDTLSTPQFKVTANNVQTTTPLQAQVPEPIQPTQPIDPSQAPLQPEQSGLAAETEKVKSISFADATVPINGTTIYQQPVVSARTDAYYSTDYIGGNLTQITSYPLDLKYVNAKGYNYYRNIKICAYSAKDNGETVETVDADPLYVRANGAQFVLSAMAINQTNADNAAKKTITVTTGTIHPDDLFAQIFQSKISSNKTYYFTLSWKGEPNAINARAYQEALAKQGRFDAFSTAGNEPTQADILKEREVRGSAVMKYFGLCAVTSAACNSWGGPTNTVMGALMDCGLPLIVTPLRQDFAGTSLGATVLSGVQSGLNALITGLNSVLGVFVDWEIPAVDFFDGIKLETKSWKLDEVKQEVVWEGTGIGALQGLLTPNYINRFAGGVNKTNSGYIADQLAELYTKKVEDSIRKSIDAGQINADGLESFLGRYKESVKAKFVKNIEKLVDDKLWERTTNNPLKSVVKSPNGQLYKVADTSLETNMGAIIEGVDEINPQKLLTQGLGTGASGIEEITMKTLKSPSEVASVLKPNSELAKQVSGAYNLAEDVLNTEITKILSDSKYVGADGKLITELPDAELEKLVEKVIDKTVPDLTTAERSKLTRDITKRVIGKSKITTAGFSFVGGTDIKMITKSIRSEGQGLIQQAVLNSPSAKKGAELAAKEIGEAAKKLGDDAVKDMTKKDIKKITPSRLRSLLSTKTLGYLGWGAACGFISNAVGMSAYESAKGTGLKEIGLGQVKIGNYTLEKGKTYQMVVVVYPNMQPEPTFTEVDSGNFTGFVKNGKADNPIKLKSELVNGKTAEQRELTAYPLTLSRGQAMAVMSVNTEFWQNYKLSKVGDLDKSQPLAKFSMPPLQKLLFNYTSQKSMDCANPNPKKIKGPDGETWGTFQPWAAAIATTAASARFTATEIEQEAQGVPGHTWLKDHLQRMVDAVYNAGGRIGSSKVTDQQGNLYKVTPEIARQVFPSSEIGNGQYYETLIKTFVNDVAIWEQVQAQSNIPDFCS